GQTTTSPSSKVGRRRPIVPHVYRTEPGYCFSQPFAERHLGLPLEMLPGEADIWLPPRWIVLRQVLKLELALGAGQLQHRFGQLFDGELAGVAQVDWSNEIIRPTHHG